VFYELEQVGLAMKPDPGDQRRNRRRSIGWPPGQQDITDAVTHLRDKGVVPWSWIADEERQIYVWDQSIAAGPVEPATLPRRSSRCLAPPASTS
jgi:hypothetical protein